MADDKEEVTEYAKAKPSVLSGKPIHMKLLEDLATEVFKVFGVQVDESLHTCKYNSCSAPINA